MTKKSNNSLFDLSKKVILLTGSAGRLGTNFAEILSEYGASVVLIDIDKENNNKLERKLSKKYDTKPLALSLIHI